MNKKDFTQGLIELSGARHVADYQLDSGKRVHVIEYKGCVFDIPVTPFAPDEWGDLSVLDGDVRMNGDYIRIIGEPARDDDGCMFCHYSVWNKGMRR